MKSKIYALGFLLILIQACSLNQGKGKSIADEYFLPHPNDYITVNTSSATSTNNLKRGFYHYQKKEYQAALDNFNKSNTVGNPRLKLYLAVAHMGLGEYVKAETILEDLIVIHMYDYADVAYWYLALSYLQQEKIPAAEAIFQAFASREEGNYRQADSAIILNKLKP